MNIVKWLRICMLVLLASAGFQSCSEDEYQSRLRELIIKDVIFEADDEEADLFSITTYRNESLKNYMATADASWCQVAFSDSLSQLMIWVEPNTTFEQRKTVVTVVDIKQPTVQRTFTVTQKQNNVVRTSQNSYDVAMKGGTVDIVIEHNVNDYTLSCDYDWIVLPSAKTRGLEKSTLTLTVLANDSGAERQGIVTIDSETTGISIDIVIKQEWVFIPSFNLPITSYTIDENGGTVTITANTNLTQFDIYDSPEDRWWASFVGVEFPEKDVAQIVFNIEPFTDKAPSRETLLTIRDADVTITQVRSLYIVETEVSMLQQDSQVLTLHNVTGDAVSWSSSDETIARVDENGKVTGIAPGSATITVASADGKYTDTATATVVKPQDIREQLNVEWQTSLDFIDGSPVVSSLGCTLNNLSEHFIQLTKCELYCDLKFVSAVNYNEQSGQVAAKDGSKRVMFDNLTDKGHRYGYTIVWYYTYNGENFIYRCEYTE